VIEILGVAAGAFAALLIVLPTARVAQGRLKPRQAIGLWISALGFALLAAAALLLDTDAAPPAVLAGVVITVIGNVIQRRNA
jgi:hypothetical protein